MADRITNMPASLPAAKPVLKDSVAKRPPVPRPSAAARYGDRIYAAVTLLASLSIFVIILWLFAQLVLASLPSLHKFGLHFLTGSDWDEDTDSYHALPFIFGTLYSSLIALILAVPVSLGAAIFLSELAPRWIRTPATFLIELLAAIPSVVYGLWGIFIMIPWLKAHVILPAMNPVVPVYRWNSARGHSFPPSRIGHLSLPWHVIHIPWGQVNVIGFLFRASGSVTGNGMLAAGCILAIMITPFITAVARDILRSIPRSQREGSYALGATQWETIAQVVAPYARSGIIGAIILGLGRALGETMAVTMVIGNQSPNTPSGISWSLLDSGYTLSSVLANKFNEASGALNTAALVEIGLVLFLVTIVVNICARLLVFYTAKDVQGRK